VRYVLQREIWRLLTYSLVEKSAQKYDVNFDEIVEYVQIVVKWSERMYKLNLLFLIVLTTMSFGVVAKKLNLGGRG